MPFTGGTSYKLTLPRDVPAANSWSLTLYDGDSASNPVQNADGSTE